MTRARPEAECAVVTFGAALPMDESSEIALEDYARVLTRARGAEAVPGDEPGSVQGVHLCGALPVAAAAVADIEGFARSLTALRSGSLGWS